PMVAPMALAVLVALAWECRARGRDGVVTMAALVGSMVAVNIPYLLFLARAPLVGRAPRLPLSLDGLGALILRRRASPRPGAWRTPSARPGPRSRRGCPEGRGLCKPPPSPVS